VRAIHAGLRRGDTVAVGPLVAAGKRRDEVRLHVNLANAMILAIDDVDIAGRLAANALRAREDRARGIPLVPLVAPLAGAGDGGNDPFRVDFSDRAAFAFADVGIALAIDADGTSANDDRLLGRAAVAAFAAIDFGLGRDLGLAGTGERGDDAG